MSPDGPQDEPERGKADDPPAFPPFEVLATERVYDSPWCALDRDQIRLEDGTEGEYHIFRIPDAVVVVPVTADGDIAMIWQHRHPHGRSHWEVPAGRMNPGETPAEAAHRELAEETGHHAGELVALPGFFPINGISDHFAHAFLALDCAPTGELDLDATERIVLRTRPLAEVRAALEGGELADGFSALALFQAFTHLDARA